MGITVTLLQLILLIGFSPLLSGLIAKIKNNIRMRKGQSVFQPYYNLAKLFFKGEVVSQTASWIFKTAPFAVAASSLTAVLLIGGCMGDLLALIFIFALGRFFLALAALDTASAFGGMGSSREMFISSLAEPVAILSIFALSLQTGSSGISVFGGVHAVNASYIFAAFALFFVAIAETSRIPVDNQETHLELTMVHEAMILEYSGRRLALIEMAAYIKQMVWFFLIARIIFPNLFPAAGIAFVAVTISLVEVSIAKMRLFRVADFLGFAFVLAAISSVCAILGA